MNLIEFNQTKNRIVKMINQTLPKLFDENNKEVQAIKIAFTIGSIQEEECIKMIMKEIYSSNPDIRGRLDTFDISIGEGKSVKGAVALLFLNKDKDRFDYRDINRFYAEYPEYFTGNFDEDDSESNQFIGDLLSAIIAVKERSARFGRIEAKSTDGFRDDFIPEIIDKVEREGLKCKAVENVIGNDAEYVYFFIYETECEAMNKQIQSLERRSSIRLVKKFLKEDALHCERKENDNI
jgi:hypothetical protein